MKIKKQIPLLFLFLLVGIKFMEANFVKAELQASGLTCSMCSYATMKSLKTIPFIDSVTTDLQHTKFILYFNPKKSVSLDKIKEKVKDAGFSVANLKVYFKFSNEAVEKDYHKAFAGNVYHFLQTDKKSLNGVNAFQVVDKGFVPDKMYKQIGKTVTHHCYLTGKTESCCTAKTEGRVYHIVMIN